MTRRCICLSVLLLLTCSLISAEKCVYQKLKRTTQTNPCSQAVNQIFLGSWQVDITETIKINQWTNNSKVLLNNIKQGLGTCVMYKMMYEDAEGCCRGWAGSDCDIATCSTPCIHGTCTGPNNCTCMAGWSGSSCDEDMKAVNNTLGYCYSGSDCKGVKLLNTSIVSKDECCKAVTADTSWGHQCADGHCFSCQEEPRSITVRKNKMLPFRTCIAGLECTVRTFDGVTYRYCTECALILVNTADVVISVYTECDPNISTLCHKTVTIKSVYRLTRYTMTNDSVAMFAEDHNQPLETIKIDSIQEHAIQLGELKVDVVGDSLLVAMPQYDIRVRRDSDIQVFVTIGNHSLLRKGKIDGACGNFDDDISDEIKLANNEQEARRFGLLATDEPCGARPREPCHTPGSKKAAAKACSVLSSTLFEKCHPLILMVDQYEPLGGLDLTRWSSLEKPCPKIDVRPYIQSCVHTYCTADHRDPNMVEEARCKAVGAYANLCAMEDVIIQWRTEKFCPRSCPSNMVYRQCGPACKPTCGHPLSSFLNYECEHCCPGCHCMEGFVFHNNTCIQPTECPCVYKNTVYEFGYNLSINESCQTCTCGRFGHWNCTTTPCQATCSVFSPGVVNTFDGEAFVLGTSRETCSYTLVSTLKSDLEIKLVGRRCGRNSESVCPRGFELKSQSQNIVIEFTHSGRFQLSDLKLNSVQNLPFFKSGIYVRQTTSKSAVADFSGFRVVFYANSYLTITTEEKQYFGIIRGLCGNLNNLISDERLLPSGVEALRDDIFVSAFSESRCGVIVPLTQRPTNEQKCTDLRLLYEKFNQTEDTIEDIYRVCMYQGDTTSICSAILKLATTAEVSLTSLLHYPLEDNDIMEKCTQELTSCEKGLTFREDIDICTSNCLDLLSRKDTCQQKIVHGCSCPHGLYRSQNGTCVPKNQCPCLHVGTGIFYKPGPVHGIMCHECHCTDGKLSCKESGCEKVVCPKDQIVVVTTTNSLNEDCLHKKCPDKYSSRVTCADQGSNTKKCVCKPGYLMTPTGTCVMSGLCPCYHDKAWHHNNTDIIDKCYHKRCNNGVWDMLEKTKCPATCFLAGAESRIETFDGTPYSFHGTSSYTLVKTQGEGAGFKISFRNFACGSIETPCSHKVDITFMGIHIELVTGAGVIVGNKTYSLEESVTIGSIKVMSTTLYTVVTFVGVTVYWSGGLLTWIQVSNRWENNLEGLCGTFDYNSKNDFRRPDSSLASDPDSFIVSWKEEDLIEPHIELTKACEDDPKKKLWSCAQCNIIKSLKAFQRCREVLPQSHIDRYVSDCEKAICQCKDGSDSNCLCDTLAHFVAVCDSLGHPAKWRNQNLCPVQCDGGMVYSSSESPCKTTCFDLAKKNSTKCDITGAVEGCFCPPGKVWHESRCILSSECPCYDGLYMYEPGTVWRKDCTLCICEKGNFECKATNCTECAHDEFKCATNGMCIHQSDVCNNFYDCYDGSDESSDLCEKKNCTSSQFQCKVSSECILTSQVCDGIAHCSDGSDEDKDKCKFVCDHTCGDGRCLHQEYICDGYVDCSDASDEMNCSSACGEGYFKCNRSGECIKEQYLCDGHVDCEDAIDEFGCTPPPIISLPRTSNSTSMETSLGSTESAPSVKISSELSTATEISKEISTFEKISIETTTEKIPTTETSMQTSTIAKTSQETTSQEISSETNVLTHIKTTQKQPTENMLINTATENIETVTKMLQKFKTFTSETSKTSFGLSATMSFETSATAETSADTSVINITDLETPGTEITTSETVTGETYNGITENTEFEIPSSTNAETVCSEEFSTVEETNTATLTPREAVKAPTSTQKTTETGSIQTTSETSTLSQINPELSTLVQTKLPTSNGNISETPTPSENTPETSTLTQMISEASTITVTSTKTSKLTETSPVSSVLTRTSPETLTDTGSETYKSTLTSHETSSLTAAISESSTLTETNPETSTSAEINPETSTLTETSPEKSTTEASSKISTSIETSAEINPETSTSNKKSTLTEKTTLTATNPETAISTETNPETSTEINPETSVSTETNPETKPETSVSNELSPETSTETHPETYIQTETSITTETNSETSTLTEANPVTSISTKTNPETSTLHITSPETSIFTHTSSETSTINHTGSKASTFIHTRHETSTFTSSKTSTLIHTSPKTSKLHHPNPETSTLTHTSLETDIHPETSTSNEKSTLAEKTTSTVTNPETALSTETNPVTSISIETSPETSTEINPETSASTETNPETSVSNETKPKASVSTESSPETSTEINPETSASTETNPETSVSNETKPKASVSTESSPETSTETNPEISITTEANPETSTLTETNPVISISTETNPETSTLHITSPETSVFTHTSSETSITHTGSETSTFTHTSFETSTLTHSSPTTSKLNHPNPETSTIMHTSLETDKNPEPSTSNEKSALTTKATSTATNPEIAISTETSTEINPETSASTETNPETSVLTETSVSAESSPETSTETNPETSITTETNPETSITMTNSETYTLTVTNPVTSKSTEINPEISSLPITSLETSAITQTSSEAVTLTHTSPKTSKLNHPNPETSTLTHTSLETDTNPEASTSNEKSTLTEKTTSTATNPETAISTETNPATSISTETSPEISSEINPETSASTETNPETSVSTETSISTESSPETSTETNLETSTETNPEIYITTETNHETSTSTEKTSSTETSAKTSISNETSKSIVTSISTEANPETSTSTETSPETFVSTETSPEISTLTETKTETTTSPETNPETSTLTETNPETSTLIASHETTRLSHTSQEISTLTHTSPETSTSTHTSPDTSTLMHTSHETSILTHTSPEISTLTHTSPETSTLTHTSPETSTLTHTSPEISILNETTAETTITAQTSSGISSSTLATFETSTLIEALSSTQTKTEKINSMETTIATPQTSPNMSTSTKTIPETSISTEISWESSSSTEISASPQTSSESTTITHIRQATTTFNVKTSSESTTSITTQAETTFSTPEAETFKPHETTYHGFTTPELNNECSHDCLSSWSCWSECPKPCRGIRVRVRGYDTESPFCKCDNEILHQAESCICNKTVIPEPLSTTASGPCHCVPPKVSTPCFEECQQSCRAFRIHAVCQEHECSTGCECPEGQLMDDDGFCTAPSYCPCYDTNSREMPFNSTYIDPTTCKVCSCSENGSHCEDRQAEFEILYDWNEWSSWSTCSSFCGNGTSSRYRIGEYQGCSTRQEESRPCCSKACQCVSENGELVHEGQKYKPDHCHICLCVNGDFVCETDPDSVVDGKWEEWGMWSQCENNCSLYHQTRSRYCKPPVCGGQSCKGPSMEFQTCSNYPCCHVYRWSDWSLCNQTCGNHPGFRTRHKIFADGFTRSMCGEHYEKEDCGLCDCYSKDKQDAISWSEWTSCANGGAVCGWGKRSRNRLVSDQCVENGVDSKQTEDCFLGPCNCSDDLVWSNHTLCGWTCQKDPPAYCSLQLSGGCVCPYGLYFNGHDCVPVSNCSTGCAYKNVTYKEGQHFNCFNCKTCQCSRGQILQVKRICPDVRQCNLNTHHLIPSEDGCCLVDCVPQETCKVQTGQAKYITVGNCTSVEKVNQQFCGGPCPVGSHFKDYTGKHLGPLECMSCYPKFTVHKATEFRCKNQTSLIHPVPLVTECHCQ